MGCCSSKPGKRCLKKSRSNALHCLQGSSFSQSQWCNPSADTPPTDLTPVDPWGPMSETEYAQYLKYAGYRFNQRFKANGCPTATLDDFEVTGYLGGGAIGAVYLIERLQDGAELALKVQKKKDIKKQNLVGDVIREKKLHFAVQNKFIARLLNAFQDSKNLYLVLERAFYGDLSKLSDLGEEVIKSMTAQVVLAFEYLHLCSVIHRDLKPANVLLFDDYYVKLSDFGIAKKIRGRTSSIIGCLPYLSPEHHLSLAYGRDFDFWLLGHFIFELSYRTRPFYKVGWTQDECKKAVLTMNVPFPSGVDDNSAMNNLIKALLEKKRCNRLGTLSGGIKDIKDHEWFRGVDFHRLFNKVDRPNLSIQPPKVWSGEGFDDLVGTPQKDHKTFKNF